MYGGQGATPHEKIHVSVQTYFCIYEVCSPCASSLQLILAGGAAFSGNENMQLC
jgi:hypothetical protein